LPLTGYGLEKSFLLLRARLPLNLQSNFCWKEGVCKSIEILLNVHLGLTILASIGDNFYWRLVSRRLLTRLKAECECRGGLYQKLLSLARGQNASGGE